MKQQIRRARRDYDAQKVGLSNVKVESRRATKDFAGSRNRLAPITLCAAKEQVPQLAAPFTKIAKTRGNIFKEQKALRAAKEEVRERINEFNQSLKYRRRKGRMTEGQKRQREVRDSSSARVAEQRAKKRAAGPSSLPPPKGHPLPQLTSAQESARLAAAVTAGVAVREREA